MKANQNAVETKAYLDMLPEQVTEASLQQANFASSKYMT